MKRRAFVKSALAAASLGGLTSINPVLAQEKSSKPMREFYELRLYHLRRGPKQKLFDDFLRDAVLPSMERHGLGPIGVFQVMAGPDSPTVYLLIPHPSLESLWAGNNRVFSDPEFLKAGAPLLDATATDPAYVRMESSLMVAFAGCPRIEVPAAAKEKKARIFELRTYESHNKKANQKKIEMFNNGEIDIFRRTGLQPVFFGETLIGTKMPNLTYLLVFENLAAREASWSKFGGDPEWKKLSSTPGYTDAEIVSNISNCFLRPAPYSQI